MSVNSKWWNTLTSAGNDDNQSISSKSAKSAKTVQSVKGVGASDVLGNDEEEKADIGIVKNNGDSVGGVRSSMDYSKVSDIFLMSDLAGMPISENIDTSSEIFMNASRMANNLVNDVLKVFKRHTTFEYTDPIVTTMTRVKKMLTGHFLTKIITPYTPSEVLYLLGKKTMKKNRKRGKLTEIILNDDGVLHVNAGDVLRNEIEEDMDVDAVDDEGDQIDKSDEENDVSPEEVLKEMERKTRKIEYLKETSKMNINNWVFSNMAVHKLLFLLGGCFDNNLLNSMVVFDLTKVLYDLWWNRFETEASNLKMSELDERSLLSVDNVSKFILTLKESKKTDVVALIDYINLDKKDPFKLSSLVYAPNVFVAMMNCWNIVYTMLYQLKKRGGGRKGFYEHNKYLDSRGVPDIRMIFLPIDTLFNCQIEFCTLASRIWSLQREGADDTSFSHFKAMTNNERYRTATRMLCVKLINMGFEGISPELNI